MAVKDRVFNHAPLKYLDPSPGIEEALKQIGSNFGMISAKDMRSDVYSDTAFTVLDFRSKAQYDEGHIPDSINLALSSLPDKYPKILPDRQSKIVCLCNGGIQSAYAVLFLRSKGYGNAFNLSGGYQSWIKAVVL